MKLSIIVPVYNTDKYLRKCIDSILAQSFRDYELILVDDGSYDESLKICYEYHYRDNRIKVIHKDNGGVSSARNAGLEVARGEYVGFVDSDDYILPNMYEVLLNKAEELSADITSCKLAIPGKKKNYNFDYPVNIRFSFLPLDSAWQRQYFEGNMETFVPIKVFKKSYLDMMAIKFTPCPFLEDRLFLQDLYISGATLAFVDKTLYLYRTVSNSAVRKYYKDRFDIFCIIYQKDKALNETKAGGLYDYEIKHHMASAILQCIMQEGRNKK